MNRMESQREAVEVAPRDEFAGWIKDHPAVGFFDWGVAANNVLAAPVKAARRNGHVPSGPPVESVAVRLVRVQLRARLVPAAGRVRRRACAGHHAGARLRRLHPNKRGAE